MSSDPTGDEFRDHRPSGRTPPDLKYPCGEPPEFGDVKKLAEGLYWLRMPLPFALDHINLYLLEDSDGWVILDTGLNTSLVRDHWRGVFECVFAGTSVLKIIVTHYHPDHIGLAGWLAAETGAPILAPRTEFLMARNLSMDGRADAPAEIVDFYRRIGFSDAALAGLQQMGWDNYSKIVSPLPQGFIRIKDGDRLAIGAREWQVVVGTGHAPEHACLYCEPENILISGDQVLPRISSNVSVYPSEPMANPLLDWLLSLRKFHRLAADTLVLPAHNEPFMGLYARLDHMFEGHMERLAALADFCQTPQGAIDAFPVLFKGTLSGLDFFLGAGESLAHLHFLEQLEILERLPDGDVVKFRTVAAFDRNILDRHLTLQGRTHDFT